MAEMVNLTCRVSFSAIDGVSSCPGSRWERFKEVAFKVLEQGITWERIAVLFYVAGKLAVKVSFFIICCLSLNTTVLNSLMLKKYMSSHLLSTNINKESIQSRPELNNQ